MSQSLIKKIVIATGIVESMFVGAGLAGFMMNLRRRPEWDDGKHILSQDDMLNDYYRRQNLKWAGVQKTKTLLKQSFDGYKLKAHYVYNGAQTDCAERKIVLFSHGYGGKGLWDMSTFMDYYAEKGYDMLFPDQRTHGDSEGQYIGFGALESYDLCMWATEIVKMWGKDCKIILHGWSMGASSAYLAVGRGMPSQVKGLIFDCGYCSAFEQFVSVVMHRMHLPKGIAKYMVHHMDFWCRVLANYKIAEASPLQYAERMTLPVLFIHGEEDKFVPKWMSDTLYKATKNVPYKEQLIVPGAGHVMSYVYGRQKYQEAMERLLNLCM